MKSYTKYLIMVRYVQLIELLDIGIKENKGYTKVVC